MYYSKYPLFILFACFFCFTKVFSQEIIPLYATGKVPNAINGDIPTLTVYKPENGKSDGTGIIICSGGAYLGVADVVEGIPAAKKLTTAGITCFLLQYRVPDGSKMTHKETVPVMDAQRAIQYVREHAKEFKIDKNKLGIMGFSAGGHLVSTLCTHLNDIYIDNPTNINLKPDFMALIYPVISFTDSLTHIVSRLQLIGPDITSEKIHYYSNELHVSHSTPPTFIVHAMDDDGVSVKNSLYFYAALQQHQVPAKLFLYAKGRHAFGAYNKEATIQWIDPFIEWINKN
ncbi:alpha/beta hydrolase [Chitinophaga sancti]|uniref:Acetyl esterase/lipase n=1 Tax=Chitinophaga sancti TaxID=1004 RepID=A0A1K1S361_9BACT|nr:alpha/beta hydrolase [Chitinophaga sancti]WQD59641.1 alpha/beta hydrolase [Chitinophaga sancti]WQG88228.1 alpha/beta hydrolase [Chitinophaga sancti]SFW78532.1 Acetyl esterase/lipase [Chitinophaga sancti]